MRPFLLTAALATLIGCSGATAQSVQQLAAGRAQPITAAERQQGQQADKGIVQEYGGAYQGPQAAYAARIGQKIAVQSGLSSNPGAFDVTLLNSPVNNAFAIPGGYVYVTRQLMALMNDEAELAAVLGHEVAHVAARHSARRQSAATRNTILGALGQVVAGAVLGSDSAVGGLLQRGIGAGAQLATLGYSRGQETQSDDLGIAYLRRAGYDPTALAAMLDSLARQTALDQQIAGDARAVPAWASTHPDPASRVRRAATQAGSGTGASNRDAYLAAIDGMLYGEDPKQGVIDGRTFVHPGFRLAFTVPAGFRMQNGASAVTIVGPNTQAQFTTAAYNGDLAAYVGDVIRKLGAASAPAAERTTINGIPAAFTAVRAANNGTAVDVSVFAYAPPGGQAYHFLVITPAGNGLGAMGSAIESFRSLTSAEAAAAAKPRYVRIATVKAGDTAQSLSARMVFPDYRLERFLVLNGLEQGEALQPGTKVKLVTY